MTRRAASPALSENEVDIAGSLFTEDLENSNTRGNTADQDGFGFDAEGIFNAAEGSDDDEAFIALQQAASFRKTSNIKGKSVKKGGGFQAMGTGSPPPLVSSCTSCVVSVTDKPLLLLCRP